LREPIRHSDLSSFIIHGDYLQDSTEIQLAECCSLCVGLLGIYGNTDDDLDHLPAHTLGTLALKLTLQCQKSGLDCFAILQELNCSTCTQVGR